MTMTHLIRPLLVALALVVLGGPVAGCAGRKTADALGAARDAVNGAGDSERCAEAEFRAAQSLLDQANAAYEAREFSRARQLAEAAQIQAERAQRVAAENAENCDRITELTEQITDTTPEADPNAGRPPVITDYDLVPVYFDFDQSSLPEAARDTLNAHAEYLLQNTALRLTLQGHCDEQGSTEYNMALGESRARTVRDYLARLGVAADRLVVVSYGEEMPASATDHDRNRRVAFVPRR